MYKVTVINSEAKTVNVYTSDHLLEDEITFTLKKNNTTTSIPKSLFIVEIEKLD